MGREAANLKTRDSSQNYLSAMVKTIITCAVAAVVAFTLQGCSMCNHSMSFTCSMNNQGTGSCESGKGASHSKATSIGECRGQCGAKDGCKYYSFCADSSGKDCGLFKNMCGMINADDCKMVKSIGRDKLVTYSMYNAKVEKQEPSNSWAPVALASVGGVSLAAFLVVRRVRTTTSGTFDMAELEELGGDMRDNTLE